MRPASTHGTICIDGDLGVRYALCALDFVERDDDTFEYVFTPNYAVMDLLPVEVFQGIPGLDLDLRLDRYVRANMTPVFIEERSPAPNREDLWDLLEMFGMDRPNRLEWLIRTDMRYSGDPLYVVRREPVVCSATVELAAVPGAAGSSARVARRALEAVCLGEDVVIGGYQIDDGNRKEAHDLLMALCAVDVAASARRGSADLADNASTFDAGRHAGRKRIETTTMLFRLVSDDFEHGLITAEAAAEKLGMSRATFFRRLKERRSA